MDNSKLPAWYSSTQGPAISQTIINITGNILPVVNLLLANKGINILPETVNVYITIGVFVIFSLRAVLGYVKAKANLQAKILSLGGSLDQ